MRFGLIPVLLVLAVVVAHAEVTLQAEVTSPVRVGETTDLSITANGTQNLPAPSIPGADGLQVRYFGPETQVSIVNGSMSASVRHRYRVTATKPGDYQIGPITAELDGKTLTAAPVTLRVVPGGAAAPNGAATNDGQLRLMLSTPRTEVFLHEQLPVTLRLMIGNVRVAQLAYPILTGDGFSADKFPEPARTQERTPDGVFQVFDFKTTLTPLRTGTVTIGPATIQLEVMTGRRRSIFDEESKQVQVQSDPITFQVLAVPDAGKPVGFAGAVGQFDFDASAAPLDLTVGDPVTVLSVIRGTGTFEQVAPPVIGATDALKVYPVQPGNAPAPGGVQQKSFEQVVIPQHEGRFEIPALRFSWFDPQARSYRTITKGPFPLTVRPGKPGTGAPQITGEKPATTLPPPAEQLGRDIVTIKDDVGTLRAIGTRRWQSPLFWIWLPLPWGVWCAATWFARRRDRATGDERWVRFTRAGRDAKAVLAAARAALGTGDRGRAYDQAATALRDYLAAKLDLPPGGVTGAAVADRLVARRLDASIAGEVTEFFADCEQVRFASSAAGDAEATLTKADRIVQAFERLRGLGVLVGVLLLAGLAVAAGEGAQTIFFRGNALYGEGKYAEAAAEYEKVRATGSESGAVYFNLGNAYFKAGDIGRTILNYERARQFLPGDPDLRANLVFARERSGDPDPVPLWAHVLLPLADRVATEALFSWAMGLVVLAVLASATGRVWPVVGRASGFVVVASAVVALITAASAGYRYLTIDGPTLGVVLGPAAAAIRFEPQPSGTMHFEGKPGAVLRIVGDREGWFQVERADGRRGWLPTDALARVFPIPPTPQ